MKMGRIFDTVVKFFEDMGWSFSQIEGRPILKFNFIGRNGQWICYAHAREEHEQLIFYSICPALVPEEKKTAMMEFISRANYGLTIGNFEMSFPEGEVRFKTSIDVEGEELTPGLIRNLIQANIAIMDRYLPGIMAVIHTDISPAEAIAEVEGST